MVVVEMTVMVAAVEGGNYGGIHGGGGSCDDSGGEW